MSKKVTKEKNKETLDNSKKEEKTTVKKSQKKEKEKTEKKEIIKNEEVEIVKEVKIEVKKEKKKSNNWILILVAIVVILIAIFGISKFTDKKIKPSDDIKSVKRVLKAKYLDVSCINSNCDGIAATKGNKLKKTVVEIYNAEGKKIGKLKNTYSVDDKFVKTPYDLTNSYFLVKTTSVTGFNVEKYSVYNKRGKEVFSSKNELAVISEKYILEKNKENGKTTYNILKTNGKDVYSGLTSYNAYANHKYMVIGMDKDYSIINSKLKVILTGYSISEVVTDENDSPIYLIVRNRKDQSYHYFSLRSSKIKGDSFISYTGGENNEYIITKKINDETVKYTLKENGKQVKIEEISQSELVKSIKEQIDENNYKIYNESIVKKGQKKVLVDSKEEKSFGVLNLDNNKFTPLYKYNQSKSYYYSTVTKLQSQSSDLYLKITCSSYVCGKPLMLVYDFEHSKELFKSDGVGSSALNFIQYEGNYKVVKYSTSSTKQQYRGKYVLYDKNNKELIVASKEIVVLGKKTTVGSTSKSSLVLYSIKDNKLINDESYPASIMTINDTTLYKYTDSKENSVIADSTGKEVISVDKDGYLTSSGNNIIYLKDNKVSIYNAKKGNTKIYKLRDNEKLNNSYGEILAPYRGAIFVNNSNDKYIKVVNSKGKVIKKIKKAEIYNVKKNSKNYYSYIIVKKEGKTGDLYGLYIAK